MLTKHRYYKNLKYIFDAQRVRCKNTKHKAYKNYGAKGINVEYSFKEFFSWCLENGYSPGLCIGRIDHSKGYSLNNIQIETRRQSTIERNERLGNPAYLKLKTVSSYCYKTGKKIKTFDSINECASFYKKTNSRIVEFCKKKRLKTFKNITFRYGDGSCL